MTPELLEPVGAHGVQAPEGVAVRGTRPDGVLDDDETEIGLPHLVAEAGDDHGQLSALNLVELAGVGRLGGLEGLVGVSQCAFAVDLDGSVKVETGQSPSGSDLSKRLTVVTGEVRGDACGLAYDRNTPSMGGSVASVFVGGVRVVVQQSLSHDEVAGDVLGIGAS